MSVLFSAGLQLLNKDCVVELVRDRLTTGCNVLDKFLRGENNYIWSKNTGSCKTSKSSIMLQCRSRRLDASQLQVSNHFVEEKT